MGGRIDGRCLPPAFSEGCPTTLLDYIRNHIPEYNWWGNFSDAIDFGSSSFRRRLSIVGRSVIPGPHPCLSSYTECRLRRRHSESDDARLLLVFLCHRIGIGE